MGWMHEWPSIMDIPAKRAGGGGGGSHIIQKFFKKWKQISFIIHLWFSLYFFGWAGIFLPAFSYLIIFLAFPSCCFFLLSYFWHFPNAAFFSYQTTKLTEEIIQNSDRNRQIDGRRRKELNTPHPIGQDSVKTHEGKSDKGKEQKEQAERSKMRFVLVGYTMSRSTELMIKSMNKIADLWVDWNYQ